MIVLTDDNIALNIDGSKRLDFRSPADVPTPEPFSAVLREVTPTTPSEPFFLMDDKKGVWERNVEAGDGDGRRQIYRPQVLMHSSSTAYSLSLKGTNSVDAAHSRSAAFSQREGEKIVPHNREGWIDMAGSEGEGDGSLEKLQFRERGIGEGRERDGWGIRVAQGREDVWKRRFEGWEKELEPAEKKLKTEEGGSVMETESTLREAGDVPSLRLQQQQGRLMDKERSVGGELELLSSSRGSPEKHGSVNMVWGEDHANLELSLGRSHGSVQLRESVKRESGRDGGQERGSREKCREEREERGESLPLSLPLAQEGGPNLELGLSIMGGGAGSSHTCPPLRFESEGEGLPPLPHSLSGGSDKGGIKRAPSLKGRSSMAWLARHSTHRGASDDVLEADSSSQNVQPSAVKMQQQQHHPSPASMQQGQSERGSYGGWPMEMLGSSSSIPMMTQRVEVWGNISGTVGESSRPLTPMTPILPAGPLVRIDPSPSPLPHLGRQHLKEKLNPTETLLSQELSVRSGMMRNPRSANEQSRADVRASLPGWPLNTWTSPSVVNRQSNVSLTSHRTEAEAVAKEEDSQHVAMAARSDTLRLLKPATAISQGGTLSTAPSVLSNASESEGLPSREESGAWSIIVGQPNMVVSRPPGGIIFGGGAIPSPSPDPQNPKMFPLNLRSPANEGRPCAEVLPSPSPAGVSQLPPSEVARQAEEAFDAMARVARFQLQAAIEDERKKSVMGSLQLSSNMTPNMTTSILPSSSHDEKQAHSSPLQGVKRRGRRSLGQRSVGTAEELGLPAGENLESGLYQMLSNISKKGRGSM